MEGTETRTENVIYYVDDDDNCKSNSIQMTPFWDIVPCILAEVDHAEPYPRRPSSSPPPWEPEISLEIAYVSAPSLV
jgi:hypothetical protein